MTKENNEEKQYSNVCKPAFERIDEHFDDVQASLKQIKQALYIGNGKPSLMVRFDRVERIINIICWLTGAWMLAAIAAFVNTIFELVKGKQ